MNNFQFERMPGKEAYRDQMVRFVVDHVTESETEYSNLRQMWPKLYDLWRGSFTSKHAPTRNSVHIPIIFSNLWAQAARMAGQSLSSTPLVSFVGAGPDDAPIARKHEALFAAQGQDDKLFLKQVTSILSAALYGRSITKLGWKQTKERRVIQSVEIDPISGAEMHMIRKGDLITFDGPESKNVDLLDFYPTVGFTDLQEMPRVAHRYFLDLDEIRALAQAGVFDKAEVARLEREGSVGAAAAHLHVNAQRFEPRVGQDQDLRRFTSKLSRPVEVIDCWCRVPSELSPDGDMNRIVTVMNRRYLARNRPNPFWHGMKPFVSHAPMPDPHYFYAPGKAEIVAKLQLVANRYVNQSLDAADLMIDPMWFYDRNAGIRTSNLYSKPGLWVPVNGNPANAVTPMIRDLSGLTVADAKIAQMREAAQMGTGLIEDAVQGLQGSSRQTAREFMGRREAAGTRLLLEGRIYEAQQLEPLAEQFMAMNRQFLEGPVEVSILGGAAEQDPVSGQMIPTTKVFLTSAELLPMYSARAQGASMALSKMGRVERYNALMQALATPLGQQMVGQINTVNFFRSIARDLEIPNVNELFSQNPALADVLAQASGGQGLQGVPSSGQMLEGAPPAQALAGMGPDMAAQMGPAALMTPTDISSTLPQG